jgi:hypothetical protein
MVSTATLFELETGYLDKLSRPLLLDALRKCAGCLPVDLGQQAEEAPTEWLRLCVFAGRLIQVLRRLPH